jgi:Ni,Fe-hydrogenase III large subunit/Ni,Fe-hydrogenase III small subunit/Ni,Fe-hydrogenase III component G
VNVLPELQPIVADIQKRFTGRLNTVGPTQPNEIYFHAKMDLVAGFCGHLYKKWNARLVSLFAADAQPTDGAFHLYYVFALDAAHGFFILRTPVMPDNPEFTSLTNAVHAVNWQEREVQDLFGLKLVGHPNPHRCALHDDWPEVFPLRKDFDLRTKLPPFEGERHQFRMVEGEGVFQVPVGPVHAGIIEPGHFLFSVAGEPVLYLQLRLFYTHKGTEKLFESLPVAHGVRLAESVSGDSSFAHATAFCHAVERAASVEAPPRARFLRSICLELERLYNHIADIGAICTDVAFVTAHMHAMRLKERVLRVNEQLTGNRLLRGMACLGGVRFDWDAGQLRTLSQLVEELKPEFESLVQLIEGSSSTIDRLEHTGVLQPEVARELGIVGIAGRASGFDHDLRRDLPHAAYDQVKVNVPVYQTGDVEHRMQVRIDEVRESLSLVEQFAASLPAGSLRVDIGELPAHRVALGYVEGWRGEIFYWVRTAPGNRLTRCKIKDPSLQNWPALSEAILGNIAMCPTGAVNYEDANGQRVARLDLAKCIFCGLCADVDKSIRMTNVCECAARQRAGLVTSAGYSLKPDDTHDRLVSGPSVILPSGGVQSPAQRESHEVLGQQIKQRATEIFGRSLHIREVDAGSCNGCEIEIVNLNSPVYDLERFGIHFVASPRHADMLLVTGPVTRNMELALKKTYDATPGPRLVVAVGACGCSGGIFGVNYATVGGVDAVIPVDVYIPGCPPNPHALLHGILLAMERVSPRPPSISATNSATR